MNEHEIKEKAFEVADVIYFEIINELGQYEKEKFVIPDEETTIREVVWSSFPNSEKKDWINKEEKEKQKAEAKAKKEDLISKGLCLKCGEYIKPDERDMNTQGYCPTC